MKKVLGKTKDIVFYIKLFPLKMHKDAYWKSKSIVCNKSLKMLEDNFENRTIPKNDCNTAEVDDNIKLADSLGITGTPTMIMPDGKIYSGTMPADKLIGLINGRQ
jgi:thiol:disulfide interchange protein DsbC